MQKREMEMSATAQHAVLSKKKQKNVIFKADWEAFGMWEFEKKKKKKRGETEIESI